MEGLGNFTDPEMLFKAASALANFYDPEVGCFVRATGPSPLHRRSRGPFPARTGATSSNRAFLATLELVFHLAEEQLWRSDGRSTNVRWHELGERLAGVARGMKTKYYSHELDVLKEHSENGRNDFTNAHLTLALASLKSRFSETHLTTDAGALDLAARIQTMGDELETRLAEGRGARLSRRGLPHSLITLHAVRAVEVARHVTGGAHGRSRVTDSVESMLRARAREDVLRQFGLYAADDAEFDPSALIAAAALLYRFAGLSARRLVRKSLETLAAAQGPDGAWKTRILTGDRQLIYIPSLELAVLVANLALWDLADGSAELAQAAAPILSKSLTFMQSGYREAELDDGRPSAGWANDQARQPDVVESWSTALAVQLLLRVLRIERHARQNAILTKYRVIRPDPNRREWLRWYDLAGPVSLVRSEEAEQARAHRELDRVSDPSASGAVRRAAWVDVVRPVLQDAFDRPQAVRSFLLYGPPGTRKTSMVKAIAGALDWPLVTLAPPDFLRGGIAAFEAQAEQIFRDLLHLRRVVVFFDECEELFRRRTVINSPEHRTQSDFITSGMLPRLQDLRDGRWVIFAIATNTELDEIDPAVSRFGRLDGQQRIGHPEVGAQTRYLTANYGVEGELLDVVARALHEYDRYLDAELEPVCRTTLTENRREVARKYAQKGNLQEYFRNMDNLRIQESELPEVTFAVLDQLGQVLTSEPRSWTHDEVSTLLRGLSEAKGRPTQWTEKHAVAADDEVFPSTAPYPPE